MPRCGCWGPAAGALPGAGLAGWQAEAVSIPGREQGLGTGSAGEAIFLFFSPSRTADPIYF